MKIVNCVCVCVDFAFGQKKKNESWIIIISIEFRLQATKRTHTRTVHCFTFMNCQSAASSWEKCIQKVS